MVLLTHNKAKYFFTHQALAISVYPMNYTVHRILQARILEWIAFPFSRGSSQLRDRTQASRFAGRFFTA